MTLKIVLHTVVSHVPSQVLEEDGLIDGLIEAAKLIVEMMQYDPHLPEHLSCNIDWIQSSSFTLCLSFQLCVTLACCASARVYGVI